MAEIPLLWLFIKQNFIYVLFFAGILLLFLLFPNKKKRITQWEKALNLPRHARTFNQLYQNINGHILSRQARSKRDSIEFIYGEIEFRTFVALMSLAQPDNNTVFYDLGSGTGKAVIACAMVFPVAKSIGIELFPQLHTTACNQLQKLIEIPEYAPCKQRIEFIQGNFLEIELSDATIIFINSTTFIGETWDLLAARLKHLPKLKTVITTTKPLINCGFSLVASTQIAVSWGMVFAYVQTKKANYH